MVVTTEGIHVDDLVRRFLDLEDDSSGVGPAAGLIVELTICNRIIRGIAGCRLVKSRVLFGGQFSEDPVLLEADGVFTVIFLAGFVQLGSSKSAVSSQVQVHGRMLCPKLLHQRRHKSTGSMAAVLGAVTKLDLQEIAGKAIEAEQGMVPMCLVMVIEGFAFLSAVGVGRVESRSNSIMSGCRME